MSQSLRPDPFFIADHVALDFLNSICAPADVEYEWLENGEDLLDWLTKSELISEETANACRASFPSAALDKTAEKARTLREALRPLITESGGAALSIDELGVLEDVNALLAKDAQVRRIDLVSGTPPDTATSNLCWQTVRHYQKADDLLLPIAEAIGHLVTGTDFTYVKNCEGPTCPLWFNDISKNHKRRWCSMSVCGNRAKAAAFRERQRKQRTGQ